jgi:hypothetical protein
LKEIIRAWGMNPEQLLTKGALADGAVTQLSQADLENRQLSLLSSQLKKLIREESSS